MAKNYTQGKLASADPVNFEVDLEVLKGQVRHFVRTEAQMLTDALYALDSGKHYVVKDHIERVMDRLYKLRRSIDEFKQLNTERGFR